MSTGDLKGVFVSDLVAEFEVAYANIIANAEQAAETTRTDAWHAMYLSFQERAKDEALDIASGLDGLASTARAMIVNKDAVDLFGKLKKRFTELNDRIEAFRESTVKPIRSPFDKANECILMFQGRAAAQKDAGGMYDKDIEDRVAESIAAQPKIRWNENIGALQVVPASKPA